MNRVHVAVLPGSRARAVPATQELSGRRGMGATVFAALGLYGALRWGDLLAGSATARLLGLLLVAGLLASGGPRLATRSKVLAALAGVLAFLSMLVISGVPLSWVINLRVEVTANAIGQGLTALPGINIPYIGINGGVRLTILLGAAVLLLDAALVLTFVPQRLGQLRRAGAALPLAALAVIPATALRPVFPYLEGVLLFVLVVAFVWGEELRGAGPAPVAVLCVLAAAVGLALAPAIDRHRPWINYRALANGLTPGGLERFDWTQGYGPVQWPDAGRTVLAVQATRSEYWKAENLDTFTGTGWASAAPPLEGSWKVGISQAALSRWTQTIQVTLRTIATNNVVAAGSAGPPQDLGRGAATGSSPGTWQSSSRLGPGDSYRVQVYTPDPSRAALASAGTSYPGAVAQDYLSLTLPDVRGVAPTYPFLPPATPNGPPLQDVIVPAFGSWTGGKVPPGSTFARAVAASPYVSALRLVGQLRQGAATPYAYVERVQRFLSKGYRYNQNPPSSKYPLESFLFTHKLGYCEHFAGAMALLLRLGGVPARVAVGFTAGSYDSLTHSWLVSDNDAHAWVEAWFPGYGWVRFDPTPGADPALGGHSSSATGNPGPAGLNAAQTRFHHHPIGPASAPTGNQPRRGAHIQGANTGLVVGITGAVLLLLLGVALLTRARGDQDPVDELSRAFARSGRPLAASATLAAIERRLSSWPDAVAYVRTVRLARYGSGAARPSLGQRRVLRRALGEGLGVTGRARALWALPPRWTLPGPRRPKGAERGTQRA